MNPSLRKVLQYLPLILQLAATAASVSIISFIVPITTQFISENEAVITIPAPSRILIEHSGAAKLVIIGLFACSVVASLVTRSKMHNEADRAIVQSAVFSIVWYLGITLLGGIVMAAFLPHLALAAGAQQ